MIQSKEELIEILQYIDPSLLSYQDWINVGFALKDAGAHVSVWDAWSARDTARYHLGECPKKWNSFRGTGTPVTAGTIVQLAMDQGWRPESTRESFELDWDATIGGKDDLVIIDRGWVEAVEVTEPDDWQPVQQLIKYLETLFEASETVGYVTKSWLDEEKGKYFPTQGNWDRTAGQLIQQLNHCNGDIGSVLGDYKPEVGAWIRFNPLDGKGCKNDNVSEYRYALVESDSMAVEQQNAILRQLELPIACLVHSGGKSLHAIVRVEATNYDEYRKRVDYLYDVCRKNGFIIDKQNKNPSRLSRMPGVMRDGHKQFLMDTNLGKEGWREWQEWIEGVNDDLPEPENMAEVWNNLPDLSPSLIDGVLRQGHKLLLAGPSKAGKSYMLIELCIALAEGRSWLGWPCAQGRVMYVNLELDRASCLHRFRDVYTALGWKPDNLHNIDIWNLRGKSVPMDKLAPKLIRRAAKKGFVAIVIDPIYKVITGDENSAEQMAHFCNQFDRICTDLGVATIYCHHHSKGYQGQKRSTDRASGSGVFARDPDALLDLIELELTKPMRKQQEDKACCQACVDALRLHVPKYFEDTVGDDDVLSASVMMKHSKQALSETQYRKLCADVKEAQKQALMRSAWRVEGTLREYPQFSPVNLWFEYPVHKSDDNGGLADLVPEGDGSPRAQAIKKQEAVKEKNESVFQMAFNSISFDHPPTVAELAETTGLSEKTVRRHAIKTGYVVRDGVVQVAGSEGQNAK